MTMILPSEVRLLIDRFEEHESTYISNDYNETSLRDDFLDPFFSALGWDLNNKQGYAQNYRDVVKEESLRTTEGVKAPDFTFRIGGVRKFFVEAKKPSVNIHDNPAPAYQLRRYAWSAKLPLSILTNFREFAVYDTRFRPEKKHAASHSRVFYGTYNEIKNNWEWINSIFAKTAILKGSFDQYVDDNKAKRGTSEVDEAFLVAIEGWRQILAQDIARKNKTLDENELNFAVQRLLDRIVFLRICEDRGIEDYGALAKAVSKHGAYQELCNLFVAADAKYNSGLFHFLDETGRNEAPDKLSLSLKITDKVVRSIIEGLYYPTAPYEFSVISSDILGQVYEQFIGGVIKLEKAGVIKVDEKPAVRKAGGVYYTPFYVVEAMVYWNLGPLLKDKTPNSIKKLRIIDPACGSGSFLIGVYDYLLLWYFNWYMDNDPARWQRGKKAPLVETASGVRLSLSERRKILLTHIFGVDIDDQAVEVTKLSLLLKVLEGETEQTLQPTLSVFQERALPDLENNIKCGNSLINSDFYDQADFNLNDIDLDKVNVFDWSASSGFESIMLEGGFDVVIGNPPYIFARDNLDISEKAYFNKNYTLTQDKHNTFLLFMELMLRILSKKGSASFIVPNSWMTMDSGIKIRNVLIDRLSLVIDMNYAVFRKVSMEPSIFIVSGSSTKGKAEVQRATSYTEFISGPLIKFDKSHWSRNDGLITLGHSDEVSTILDQVRQRSATIGQSFDVKAGLQAYETGKGTPPQTKTDVKQHIYDAAEKLNEDTYRYLDGRSVRRFAINWQEGRWMQYGPWLAQPRNLDMFRCPRVLIREITGPIPFAFFSCFTNETFLSNKSVLTVLHSKNDVAALKSLSGFLNSKLATAFQRNFGVKGERKLFPKVLARSLRKLPYPSSLDGNTIDRMGQMYDRIVGNHAALITAKTPHARERAVRDIDIFQGKLDDLVFDIFEITESDRQAVILSVSAK